MSKPVVYLSVLVLCCFSTSRIAGQTLTTASKPTSKPPQPKIERASWSDAASSFGISQDDFNSMGLSKLTKDQYAYLLGWAYQRDSNAKEAGKKEGMEAGKKEGFEAASNARITYSCGPPMTESSVTKISLVVSGNDTTPPVVLSGILQRLRGLSDVQIVYDEKDADLAVSIVAFENVTETSNRSLGYTASVSTGVPCVSKIGNTDGGPFKMQHNHFLQASGKDVKVLVEGVVSLLDSQDFESIRKDHTFFKKILEQQKK